MPTSRMAQLWQASRCSGNSSWSIPWTRAFGAFIAFGACDHFAAFIAFAVCEHFAAFEHFIAEFAPFGHFAAFEHFGQPGHFTRAIS